MFSEHGVIGQSHTKDGLVLEGLTQRVVWN